MKKKIIYIILIAGVGGWIIRFLTNIIHSSNDRARVFEEYYQTTYKWLIDKCNGKTIENLLLKKNIKCICIYGAGSVGKLLYEELKNSSIEIAYVVDKYIESTTFDFGKVELYSVEKLSELKQVDAMIITPMGYADKIKKSLEKEHFKCPIMLIDEIV